MKYNFFIKCTESFPQMVLAIFGGLMPGIFDFFIANKNFPKICFIELVKRHPKNDFSFFCVGVYVGEVPFSTQLICFMNENGAYGLERLQRCSRYFALHEILTNRYFRFENGIMFIDTGRFYRGTYRGLFDLCHF